MSNSEIKQEIINNIKYYFQLQEVSEIHDFRLIIRGRITNKQLESNPELMIPIIMNMQKRMKEKIESAIIFMETQLELLEDGSKFPRLNYKLNLDI